MAKRICWKCGTNSHMTVHGGPRYANQGEQQVIQAAFHCDECNFLSIAMLPIPQGAYSADVDFLERSSPHWFPIRGEGKIYTDVPDHIAAAASEAHVCDSVSAYRAAVLLARSVIEATAKDKGITRGNLVAKIDAMHDADIIGRVVKEGAHEVRHFGNDMAHGDFLEPVDEVDATEVLTLMAHVLHDAYQQEAQVVRLRAAREAREAAAAE